MDEQKSSKERFPSGGPLVSIITPTLNSEAFVEDNIRSIRSQTYPNIEHVIVDGVSTDSTLDIVKKLDPDAVVISEKDRGISDAFNKGLRLAKGDIIAILNSDDYYADERVVEKVVEEFRNRPETELLYGKVRCVDQQTGHTLVIYGEPFSFRKMLKAIITPHPALFATRRLHETVGDFSLDYKVSMDHEYFVRATAVFEPYFLDDILTVMRWGGYSAVNIFRAHREVYRTIRAHGGGFAFAAGNLIYGYLMTALSLLLQKSGMRRVVLLYRKWKRQL